jgi:hypothetical protein
MVHHASDSSKLEMLIFGLRSLVFGLCESVSGTNSTVNPPLLKNSISHSPLPLGWGHRGAVNARNHFNGFEAPAREPV